MRLTQGQSFFSHAESGVGRHLWVIVSDPAKDSRVAIVNLSTQPTPGTSSRQVAAGEHPSVTRPSCVRYELARLTPAQKVSEGLAKRVLSSTKSAPPALVKKLQALLGESDRTKNEVKELLRAQGLIQ